MRIRTEREDGTEVTPAEPIKSVYRCPYCGRENDQDQLHYAKAWLTAHITVEHTEQL